MVVNFFSYFFNIFQKQSKVWIKEIGEVEENGWMSLICPKGRKILNKNGNNVWSRVKNLINLIAMSPRA